MTKAALPTEITDTDTDTDDRPEYPAHIADLITTARRQIANASTVPAKLAALLAGAQSLAIPVRHGGIDRTDAVDHLHHLAENHGLCEECGDAVLHTIARGLDHANEGNGAGEWTDDDPDAPWMIDIKLGGMSPRARRASWEAEQRRPRHNGADLDEPPPAAGPEDYGVNGAGADASGHGYDQLPLPPLTIAQWLDRDLPVPDYIMGKWLTTTTRAMLAAATGLGKTNVAMALTMHAAAGQDFLHWRAVRPVRVLYIDGEMSRRLFRERIEDACRRLGAQPETFHAFSREDAPNLRPLNTPNGQRYIDALVAALGGVDFICFDSIMCLLEGDPKDPEAWQKVLPWSLSLTRRRIGQLWLNHTGHDEAKSYGDKTKEWQMDTVIHCERAAHDATDVCFNLEFRKARERRPETRVDFQPVRIALVNDVWEHDGEQVKRPGKVAPLDLKFLDALLNVLAGDDSTMFGRQRAATTASWKAECIARGLIDPEKPNSARTLFGKARRELVAANRIACEGDLTWTI